MTIAIRSYAAGLGDVIRLANGEHVVIRPVLPRDIDMLRAFVRSLSDEARYFRFLTRLTELPEVMAERFTRIDYRSHVALIAEVHTEAGGVMIGEARYIVDEDAADVCEFAIAVADDWGSLGLARTMLGRLSTHAASSGIRRMTGDTLATNKSMIGLASRCGFKIAHKRQDGRLASLVKELQPPGRRTGFPGTSLADHTAAA